MDGEVWKRGFSFALGGESSSEEHISEDGFTIGGFEGGIGDDFDFGLHAASNAGGEREWSGIPVGGGRRDGLKHLTEADKFAIEASRLEGSLFGVGADGF